MYDQAVQVVTETGKASISYVQRRLQVAGVAGELCVFLFEPIDAASGLLTHFGDPRLEDEEDDGDHEEQCNHPADHIAAGGAGLRFEFGLADRA